MSDAAVARSARLAEIVKAADVENPEWAKGARFVLGWMYGPSDATLAAAFAAVRDPATVIRARCRDLDYGAHDWNSHGSPSFCRDCGLTFPRFARLRVTRVPASKESP